MIKIPEHLLSENCPHCKQKLQECCCKVIEKSTYPQSTEIKPIIKLDKKKRKGKVVTLITNLPTKEIYLKELSKKLKSQTGSGGTYYIEDRQGIIEIQGAHVQKLETLLKTYE